MNIQPDFADFLRLLESHRVEYMIVGGYAVAYHGFPRFTKDIDIFFSDTPENAARVRQALVDFGFADDLLQNKRATGRTRDMADVEELE